MRSPFSYRFLQSSQVPVFGSSRLVVGNKFENGLIQPPPQLGVTVGKGKRATFVVPAGGQVPPAPVTGGQNAESAIVDAVLVFVDEHRCLRWSRITDAGQFVID